MKIFKSSLALVLALILAFSPVGMMPENANAAELGDVVTTADKLTLKCINIISGYNAWEVTGYSGDKADVVIPEYYKDLPVMSIGAEALAGNTKIKSVTIPASVRGIGSRAFKNCTSLESFTIEGDCYDWITEHIPLLTGSLHTPIALRQQIFEGCTSLKSFELPYGWFVSGNAYGDRLMSGSGIKYLKLVITSRTYQEEPYCFFNECPDLEKVDIILKKHVILNIQNMGDLPGLKEINIYEDYDIGSGGEITGITNPGISGYQYEDRHISRCPNLKYVNVYVGPEAAERKMQFNPFTNTTITAEGDCVEYYTRTAYEINSEGTAEFSCPEATYKVRLIVGDGNGTSKKDLKDAKVTLPADTFVYTGEEITPYAQLTYGDTLLVEDTDYTVKCEDNKAVGTAKITFTGKGDYTGSISADYYIGPDLVPVYLKKAVITKKTAKLEWNTFEGADGYQVYYSKKESKGYKKLYSGKDTSLSTKTVKSGTYIKIRTYKKIGKKTYYSAWSTPVQVK